MMSIVPVGPGADFVYQAVDLNRQTIQAALTRTLHRDVCVNAVSALNLCRDSYGGVSNSGATVLRLSLVLAESETMDLVAKILSPDAVNLFQPDCRFSARLSEIAWTRWWGQQSVTFVPHIYDTRLDLATRQFWVLREYVAQLQGRRDGRNALDELTSSMGRLALLCATLARLHSHSHLHLDDLLAEFSGQGIRHGHLAPPDHIVQEISEYLADLGLCADLGIEPRTRRLLGEVRDVIANRPSWVDEWLIVCVTADWQAENLGLRRTSSGSELVLLDWGACRLAPMEEEIDILLRRLPKLGATGRERLVRIYLDAFEADTGVRPDAEGFRARLPWARLCVHMRYVIEHLKALQWVPHQTRSRDLIDMFVPLCYDLLPFCRQNA